MISNIEMLYTSKAETRERKFHYLDNFLFLTNVM